MGICEAADIVLLGAIVLFRNAFIRLFTTDEVVIAYAMECFFHSGILHFMNAWYEIPGGTMRGMGLLPVSTVFTPEKTRTRVNGCFGNVGGVFSALSGQPFEGYEIHMGVTENTAAISEILDSVSGESRPDGCQNGNVYGSYVHGILDRDEVAGAIIQSLAMKKGIDPSEIGKVSGEEHKQQQYDLLADTLRKSMDMDLVYRIFEEGLA